MYRYSNGQIRLSDFKQPMGMNLKEDNRWVKRALLIPWNDIEKRYASLFTNRKGNVAKPLRLALGACIIQADYGYSDEETALQIQENAYLQYFCGYEAYDDSKPPFDSSLMVYFRKRLTAEVLGEINEMILVQSKATLALESVETPAEKKTDEQSETDDDDKPGPPANSGTMIVDATCAPSQIRFPQDTALLNEARENTEAIIDALHISGSQKPRTYRKRAHKDYLKLVRCRKPSAKKIRKCIGQQLRYLRRNLNTIEEMKTAHPNMLSEKQQARLDTIHKVYEQQKIMYDTHTHHVSNRIVSLSQPWLRPIVRGKAKTTVEFGAKQDYQDQSDRVEVERQFSLAKRKCGLGMIVTRLEETTCHCLAMSVLLLNLRKLQRLLHALFRWWFCEGKMPFVQ